MGDGFIALDGHITNYRSKRPQSSLSFSGILEEDALKAALKARFPDDFSIQDGIKFSGKAVTRKGEVTLDAHFDSKAASLNLQPFIAKDKDVSLRADIQLMLEDTGLTIRRANITAGDSLLTLKGTLQKKSESYSLSITSKKLYFNDLDMILPYLDSDFDSTGTLSLNLNLAQKSKKRGSRITGEARIKGGSFSTSFMSRDISRLDGVVTFNGSGAKGHIEALQLGRSSFSGELDVTSISERTVTFNLTSPYLDLSDIAVKKRIRKGGDFLINTVSGKGTLTVKEGQFFFLKVSSCDSELLLTHEKMHFSPISCIIGDGRVSGEVEYFTANLPTLFSLSLNLDNVEWESFLRDLGVKRKVP